jgi:hypothetical protein
MMFMSSSDPFVTFNLRGRYPAARRTWSADDVRQLRELAEQGVSIRIIAARLRKTESAIRNKAGMHGISISCRGAHNERQPDMAQDE